MKSIVILAFFLPFISTMVQERTATAESPNVGEFIFTLTVPADDDIMDIYSSDMENRCSYSLGNFTITKQNPKTYSITIVNYDKSRHPCGSKVLEDGSFAVTFWTKSGKRFFTDKDRIYTIVKCARTLCHLTTENIPNFYMNSDQAQMKIISYNNTNINNGDELTKFEPGLNAKLQITSHHELRVTWCYIDNGSDKFNGTTVHDIQCSQQKFNTLPFEKTENNPVRFESSSFKVEPFQNSAAVRYTCFVELCYKADNDEKYCRNKNCVFFGTYQRTYKKLQKLIAVPSTGNSLTSFSGIKMPLGLLLFLVSKNL